ncbi:Replicase polyprotein [Wickerhamomyces ciferrii]|uniref:Replicase polyprotein n=1 Tax=Wickerhamomyces ciferrii (strain ATCC 14091 / BCRC 22168 / CBS 111 / JCM 3599 / NBRC 0793 / NRRL Y-1031 F-60-10) TaxID=1206466 RepID=K0KMF0_WICCF|nr:Replicase polyprotein [Wickerhamomyces ciferrii]CCH42263.1 Replicase polyprotein [Wickerhamomyces ciferrii]
MSTEELDLLQTIIQNKTFKQDHDQWSKILSLIPKRLRDIVSTEYTEGLKYEIKDPLNPKKIESIESFIDRLTKYLETNFSLNPPFTIVRFAELIINPKQFNSTGPKFLRALENVLQVSSSISDFPEPTFDIPLESQPENQKNSDVVPVPLATDDSQTMLLTKIPWLTDDDIREIESESYLLDEFPISAPTSHGEFDGDEHPIDYNQQKEHEYEVDRKRQLEGSKDSPEKKHKAEVEHDEHKDSNEQGDDEDTSTIGNDTLDEDKGETSVADTTVGDATIGDTSIADTTIGDATTEGNEEHEANNEEGSETGNDTLTERSTINEEDKQKNTVEDEENKQVKPNDISTSKKSDENENDESNTSTGNETFEEDKMDMNTTLEEDKMELD